MTLPDDMPDAMEFAAQYGVRRAQIEGCPTRHAGAWIDSMPGICGSCHGSEVEIDEIEHQNRTGVKSPYFRHNCGDVETQLSLRRSMERE